MFCGVAGSAEEFAFVDGGGSAVCPVLDMVDITVSGFCPTPFALAVSVSGGDGSALCWGPYPGFASDVEDFAFGSENDAGYRTVTGDHTEQVDTEDVSGFGFVESSG